MHPRTAAMVQTASSVDWVVVDSETEALQLEYQWIKQFAPRFNVKYRDDKSYPYLAITMNEQYPRVLVMRGDKRKGVKYFGPMPRRGRSVRLSTRSFGSSRYVRAATAFSVARRRWADRACWDTSASAAPRVSGGSPRRTTGSWPATWCPFWALVPTAS